MPDEHLPGIDRHERPAGRPHNHDAAKFVVEAARLLSDDKCSDVIVLDIRAVSQISDYVIIASGTSDRQMKSAMDHLGELGKQIGFPAYRTSTDDRATWLVADFVDAIVHLFEPATRAHYDLEMLWGDAPRIAWERPEQQTRNRAGLQRGDAL